ncbi:hypothetical protein WNZ14_02620 [Hoeflea sp. AS60]|uniref:hypothetical protein n=1 Tax=Hoeflea sp. AS60 TaxID=3135780 RepID=UPI00317A6984
MKKGASFPFSLTGSVRTSFMKGANVDFDFYQLSGNTQTAKFSLLGRAKALDAATNYK